MSSALTVPQQGLEDVSSAQSNAPNSPPGSSAAEQIVEDTPTYDETAYSPAGISLTSKAYDEIPYSIPHHAAANESYHQYFDDFINYPDDQ